jgi:5'(3')-deoxyribonucleotidase
MKIVYLDMDGPLTDWKRAIGRPFLKNSDPPEMFQRGFFRNLPVTEGAHAAVFALLKNPKVDLYIATKPTIKNSLWSTIEKYEWIQEHFPPLLDKMFVVCDKGHLNGHILVDDDAEKWGKKFSGLFIHFVEETPIWSWGNALQIIDKECR